jgi:hypothetical protein
MVLAVVCVHLEGDLAHGRVVGDEERAHEHALVLLLEEVG